MKVGFFSLFESILQAGFFDKMLALSNKNSTFAFVSGFFYCCIFTMLLKSYSKGRFFTRKAPQTTIITIFNAECDANL